MTEKILDLFEIAPVSKPTKKPVKKQDKGETKGRRGGQRSSVVSPAIDQLIVDEWFSEFKTVAEVVTELKRINIPGVNNVNVGVALSRRVPDKLDRIKKSDGKWTYKKTDS